MNRHSNETAGPKRPITRGEWNEGNYGVNWSINLKITTDGNRNEGSDPEPMEFRDEPLDLSAPEGLPDGQYEAMVSHGIKRRGHAAGVEIRDGMFVPGPTARAILKAACRCRDAPELSALAGNHVIDHIFVEGHRYHADLETIEFFMGS